MRDGKQQTEPAIAKQPPAGHGRPRLAQDGSVPQEPEQIPDGHGKLNLIPEAVTDLYEPADRRAWEERINQFIRAFDSLYTFFATIAPYCMAPVR